MIYISIRGYLLSCLSSLLFSLVAVVLPIDVVHGQSLSFFETFTDHAVLQREVPHPVWGWAVPKQRVSVIFGGEEYTTNSDAAGRWQIELPEQPKGGPHVLIARTKKDRVEISDLYFGDVYLLSGQSNMEWKVRQSDPDGSRAKAIADPFVREVTVAKSTANAPENRLEISDKWRRGTADFIGEFSAVGSYFAHYLRDRVDVPIGLIHSSWGGSRIEPWMPAHLLGLEKVERSSDLSALEAPALEHYQKNFGAAARPPRQDEGKALGYLDPKTNYADWPTIKVPGIWEENGYPKVNGHFYLAKYFELSETQAKSDITLKLGAIDDSDWTYVNGELVGKMYAAYAEARTYVVPQKQLRAGRNVLLVRVEDTGGGGGLTASPGEVRIETVTGNIPLAGQWHYRVGSWSVEEQLNQIPTILYNKMIHPLAGMPLTGVLWYQGESNAGPGSAEAYAEQFKDLINYWRSHFQRSDLPFYWVQLANFEEAQMSPDETGWGTIRESQTAALELPHTAQAVIIDIGEADDIHPQNKWEVGRRLALPALKNIYGFEEIKATSPRVIAGERQAKNTVLLRVDNEDDLLLARDDRYGYAKGFVYRDQSGEWHWARAELSPGGKTILVSSPSNRVITAVRYGFANNPTDANVFNGKGLPLTPFHVEIE